MNHRLAVPLSSAILLTVAVGMASARSAGSDVPNLNVDSSCRQATAQTATACRNDEQTARKKLVEAWLDFNAPDKARCTSETKTDAVLSSYIVLLTCLQIGADALKIQLPK